MIPVLNIYYMLSYAYQTLRTGKYAELATMRFENTADLMSAILIRTLNTQLRRGIRRGYVNKSAEMPTVRGKICMSESVRRMSSTRHNVVCDYDEFSVDIYPNRVLKATLNLLLHSEIPNERMMELSRALAVLCEVGTVDVRQVDWEFRSDRSGDDYPMMMSLCELTVKGLLQSESKGDMKVRTVFDEQRMCRLYEKFILEFYRREHPEVVAEASMVKWALDEGLPDDLPVMQTDITLRCRNRVLIIDAKYYENNMQYRFDRPKIHSHNLYQIFTYVTNESAYGGDVSGMILYARTDCEKQPDSSFMINGNRITVRTLDLYCDFDEIRRQLDGIVCDFIKSGSS